MASGEEYWTEFRLEVKSDIKRLQSDMAQHKAMLAVYKERDIHLLSKMEEVNKSLKDHETLEMSKLVSFQKSIDDNHQAMINLIEKKEEENNEKIDYLYKRVLPITGGIAVLVFVAPFLIPLIFK